MKKIRLPIRCKKTSCKQGMQLGQTLRKNLKKRASLNLFRREMGSCQRIRRKLKGRISLNSFKQETEIKRRNKKRSKLKNPKISNPCNLLKNSQNPL